MTLDAAIGRIGEIQSTLSQLDPALAAVTARAQASAGARTSSDAVGRASRAFGAALAGAVGASGSGGPTGDAVAADAQRYVGVPYAWGGTDPATGMDCSGFVQRVYADLGVSLPRVVHDQMTQGTPVASFADARPGDLLVSFGGEHVAIYLGNGKAIDAPEPGKTIQVRDAWERHANLTAIRRIVPDAGSGPGAGSVSGSGSGAGTSGLDATQLGYARAIVGEVRARGLPPQAAVAAVSTALQESSLRMYWNPKVPGSQALAPDASARGTDGYSVGLFQQQVHGTDFSWGTVADAMDPVRSTDAFLDRLAVIPGWQSLPVAAADQAVQRSAYPDAYAKWEPAARRIVAELSGTGA
ncbi:C40 family peptidase [Sinomonas sp. ASV322]|uniref:C40 family peptidase n=1 Tax=Sinomonas sp. ASV322 TaxID=3041920 RepID=UPI0027DB5521|nr:C40 family peptidase [Sinomonas sp. ASV322]MDQ4504075.1 C40 family peptidase [Sinomonas sp. ASV322]